MVSMTSVITGFALAPDVYSLVGCAVIMTVGEDMFFLISSGLVTEMEPEAERGTYVGASSLFLHIGAKVPPLLGGIT